MADPTAANVNWSLVGEIERLRATIEAQAASLAAKDKEIERRDAFIKELSDALLTVRPLGGSELFVKRFGQYYADPAYCKAAIVERHEQYHNAMKGQVRERNRAEQAESALARITAIENKGYGGDYDEIDEAREIARAFLAEHGSDSSTERK
jgi:hypothetical protein